MRCSPELEKDSNAQWESKTEVSGNTLNGRVKQKSVLSVFCFFVNPIPMHMFGCVYLNIA